MCIVVCAVTEAYAFVATDTLVRYDGVDHDAPRRRLAPTAGGGWIGLAGSAFHGDPYDSMALLAALPIRTRSEALEALTSVQLPRAGLAMLALVGMDGGAPWAAAVDQDGSVLGTIPPAAPLALPALPAGGDAMVAEAERLRREMDGHAGPDGKVRAVARCLVRTREQAADVSGTLQVGLVRRGDSEPRYHLSALATALCDAATPLPWAAVLEPTEA